MGRNFKYFNWDAKDVSFQLSVPIERIQSTSFLAKKEKEKNQRVDEFSTLPTVTRVIFGKNRRIISRFENWSFELCRSLSFFLSRPIARTDKIGEKRKTSEGGNGRQRARVRRVSHSRLIAARRNKIGSSRWQQVIGAGIDAKLVKPGCVSPSKRG